MIHQIKKVQPKTAGPKTAGLGSGEGKKTKRSWRSTGPVDVVEDADNKKCLPHLQHTANVVHRLTNSRRATTERCWSFLIIWNVLSLNAYGYKQLWLVLFFVTNQVWKQVRCPLYETKEMHLMWPVCPSLPACTHTSYSNMKCAADQDLFVWSQCDIIQDVTHAQT